MPPLRPYRWIAVLAIIGCGLLFGSVLVGWDRLAFRDVGHFYAPLYGHLGQRMADGQLPLWNPLDHTGTPVIGETTTAMFYPPRWVFALPLAPAVATGWYVVFHLVVAALAAGWAARRAGGEGAAAVFAGLAYALACPIVFLYCNPPFLVGAAWLPCGLALGLQLLETRSRRAIAAAALVFAMPVLAGDPQTPIHIAVWIGLVWSGRQLGRVWRHGKQKRSRAIASPTQRNTLVVPLLLAIGGALLIALPQVAGSLDWARHSARRFDVPQGVYHFSVAPWQWLDLLVPSSNGQLFPKLQRLSLLIPEDSRIWSVSLYGGVLTCWFCGWRYCKPLQLGAWDLLAPLGVLMAMGKFGPVWWSQVLAAGLGADPEGAWRQADPADWSPYWMLGQMLPGYESFRYPAKWLPFVSLGVAIAAARQLQDVLTTGRPPLRAMATGAGLLLLASLPLSLSAARATLLTQLPAANLSDNYWGPLDADAGLANLAFALRHAGGVLAAATALLWVLRRKPARYAQLAGFAVCGLLLVDLLIANKPLVATLDRQQESAWLDAVPAVAGGQTFLRTGDESPAVWRRTSVRHRVEEVSASERIGLQGRWHLPAGQRVFNSAVSITPQRYASFAAASAAYTAPLSWEQQNRFWLQVGGHWGLTAYLHTAPEAIATDTLDGRAVRLMDTRAIPLAAAAPTVRWHPRWNPIAAKIEVPQQDWRQHFESLLDTAQSPVPTVEFKGEPKFASEVVKAGSVAKLEVVEETAERLRLTVHGAAAGLLSRHSFQDGHWHCRYRPLRADSDEPINWTSAEVYPVDYLGQGVLLPAGDWEVEFWYRPWWLTPSLLVAMVALMVVVRSANTTIFRYVRGANNDQ